ncbi:hypothetical protein V3C99_015174 [Haemonchus contortus]
MRFLALLAACAVVASIEAVDPCKRQPFRGRCPSKNGESPKRSQFVLRYYMRNGECVSYPYGHCANDDSEPQLYRYKEECEDACINPPPANLGSPKSDIDQTYGTVGPVGNAVQPDEAAVTQTSAETTTQADNTSRSVSTQSPATTECERRRAAAAASTIRGGFVPACTAHGAFEKVQCEPDGRQCFCVDAKGIEIANSRTRNGQKPDCDGIQLSSAPKTKECVGGAARGPCSAALSRWYYDEQEAKCKKFTFSGCGGNGNNYDTEEACIRRCAPPPMGLPKCEKGEPLKTKLGVPVNCAKSDCPYGYKCSVVQQTSVCCPENNKIIGLQTSGSADVCSLPKERGPCDKYELRFYYNAELKECKYFFWGGCQGNKNNFEKVEDCEATCGIAKAKDSIPTTPAPSTQNQRLPFRTTQGIRITPGNFSKNEDGSIVESSTTVTSPPIAATAPGRVFTPEPKSAFESLVTSENIKSDPTIPATVHVAPTRAPPIPQMALLEGSEDNSANSVNRCLHPKDPGTCRGQFIRWYWDNDRKTCDVFTYTGCQGNGNNYASREECLAICHKEATPVVVHDFSNVCKHDVDAGECNGVFQRFAFDTESGECRPFTYGGCGGNGNNFATLAECRIKCQKVALSPGNLCEHDIEVGECSGVFVRFGYDKATNDCRQFTYGGCGGNGNNFATIQECRNVCIRKVCNPNPQCDLTRCQIVNDRNGCPFCSCPPTSQPSPPGALQCPEVNVDTCKEPCIIINNRKGCKDCVCPSLSGSIGQPPASFEDQDASPIAPSTSRPVTPTVRANHISARPPSAPTSVGPPSGPTPNRSSPPGTVTGHFSRRQESVPTVQSSQSKQVEIGSKQLLPPPLSAHLQEKCMQPVEPGPCKHFVDRWFFNGEDGTCHPFKYGGCAGNRNHFFSQNECEIHCARFLHRVPSVPSTPLHVHENENAADPDSKLSSAVQHSDDRKEERQRVPLSQPPAMLAKIVTTTTITTTTATTKRNIQVDRNLFSPVVTHSQSAKTNRPLDAASLPFDLPPSVRAHALPNFAPDNNKLSSLVTTTYYPETYEAWGIDLNRHPELGSDSQDRQRPPPLQREQVKVEEVARAATGRVTAEQHRNVEEQRKSSAVSPSITNFIHREQRPAGLVARESARSTTRKHLEPTAKTTIPTPRTVPSSTTRPTTLRERVYLETRTEATTRLSITKQRQNLGEFRNPPSERLPSTFSTSTERSQPQAVTNPNPRSTASKVQQIPEERFTSKPPHFSHSPTQSRPRLNGGNSETESILVRPLEPLKESIQPRADTVPPEAVQKTTPRSVVTERDRQVNAVLEEDRSSNELPPLRILEKPQLPRQQSVATHPHIYRTISIGSYNPQQNNNLAGLSPPVDPTYFTYNSQHLGGNRRQFAINNVPFTRQLPPMRTSWEPYPFRGQQARAMAPQTFSALTPEMQMRPNVPIQSNQPQTPPLQPPVQSNFAKSTSDGGLQHFSESTNIPSERDPNISNGAATTGAKNHQDGASLSNESQSHFAVQTDPNSERRTSDHVPMALNRGGTAETPVRQSGSSLFNNRAIPSSTGGGQSHTSATVQSPTRSADAPSSFQHRADPAPSLLMVQNEVKPTRRIIIEAKNSEFAQKAPIEPVGPAWSPTSSLSPIRQGSTQMEQQFNRQGSTQMEQQFNRQGSTQMEQQFNRNWAEQTQDTSPNQSNVPTAKQGDIKNVQHQSSSKRPIPQESELRKNGPSRNEFPKRIIENNRMVVSSRSNMISSIEQNVIESKRGWERANAQLNPNEVKNLRSFGSKLSPASDDDETEFPANIDRSRFIFYNGDYYAPTIPGVRIPRPDLENLPTNMQISTLEGPPTGMFRDFQRHSKEFQNVAPLGIKTHVASEDPLDIMNKSLYMKEAGTVISAPPVRVPDKRPRKLQELSEQLTINDYPKFLHAPPSNSTTFRPTHTLNQVNSFHDSPYDNFPRYMQHFNSTLTEPSTNQSLTDQANHPIRLKIQPIRSFPGIISDDDEEEEDFVEEIPRRAAGVAQVHTRDPIEFEHYHPPSPPSQGSSQPQAIHGKKIAKVPVIHMDGLMSTSSTEVSEENGNGEFHFLRTDRPPTITGQRVSRTTLRPVSTTEAPHSVSTTSRSSTVTASRTTGSTSTTKLSSPRTESTTTASADESQSSTGTAETSYGTTQGSTPITEQAPIKPEAPFSATEATTSETSDFSNASQNETTDATTVSIESTSESTEAFSSTPSSDSTPYYSSTNPLPTDDDGSLTTYLATTEKSTNVPSLTSTSPPYESTDGTTAADSDVSDSSEISSTPSVPVTTDSGVTDTNAATSNSPQISTTVSSHVESTSEETTIAPTFTDSSTPREDSTTTETTPSVVPSTEAVNLPHQSLAGSDNTIDHDSKTFDNDEHISEEEIEFFDPNNLPPPPPENERRPPMNVAPPHLYGEKVKALKKIEIRPQPIVTTSAPTFTATATDGTIPSTNDATTPAEPGDTPSGEALSPSSFEISSSEDMAGYSIGREPVPLSPTGIGRNMEKLDIDGLEEPTTIIPLATTTLPAATNATAATSTHAAATSTQATSTPQGTTGKQLSAEPSTTQTQTTLTSTVQTPTTGSPMTTTPALTTQPSTTQAASTQTSSTPPPPPPTTSTPTTQPPVTNAQTTPAPTSRPTPASSPVTTRATPQTTPQPTQPTTTRNVPRTAATVGVPTDREEIDARVLCALPPDAGPCFEYVPRWFFNAQSGQCEQFSYGSCGGNENNFADRSVCEIKCLRAHSTLLSHVPERCTYERDGGSGKGYNVKWYFNMKNLRCEQFVYEGRGGNQNQFETLSDCERYCSPQPGSPKYVIPPTTTTIRPPAPPLAPQTQPRPSAGQPLPDRQTIEDILDYDEKLSHFVEESVTSTNAPPTRPVGNTIDNRDNSLAAPAPQPPISNSVQSPATQPRPPAAQAAKTVVHKEKTPERSTNVATGQERRKEIYKAEPLPSKPPTTGNENLPIVGPSPPMSVNYQTGEVKNRASGIRTFQQSASRVIVEDSDLTEGEEPRRDLLSCPNGLKELRYADGRPVMCLPGKNQCPEKSVCYFNGVDFFCCPNEEDPYDKHVFGGYDGEETKHGYKVFGPLNIRRLMDEVPLRARREARSARVRRQASSNAFTAPQNSFSIDSITAPLRFDEEKPRTVSRAQRMRSNPSPPHHGNPICIEPLATGDCGAAHLRYYYDRDSDKCRLFYYTGCKGNNNNFGSMIDCQRLCVLGGQRPRPESDASTPPPVLRGQCPDGKSPLGGSAPVLCGNTTDSIGCPTGFFCLHGPPDICCPNGEVKRKVEKGSVRFAPEVPGVPRAHSRNVLLSTPKYMCPDASDPLMASNGEPTNCGAGFDGMKLCPKGFYCAIDVEKQSRMCCPLYGAAERVPTEQGPAPYLGRRPSNPGEVLERGSLPSDQSEYISRTRKEQMQERRRQMLETTTSVFAEESEEFEDGEEEEDEEEGMAHLMLKPAESSQPKAEPATSTALPESEDHHIIDLPTEPPTVEEAQPVKTAEDKSVCQIKPSEGRACREDEKPPRTNLHYFYSPKDRRCKLYFFRGCGGNANRFEKKADCERLCLS